MCILHRKPWYGLLWDISLWFDSSEYCKALHVCQWTFLPPGNGSHFFLFRKWGNCVLVRRRYNIIIFSPLLPGRAFKGRSVGFLQTKGNEVLISAYKNKIFCFWSSYGWLAVVCRRSLKENQADSLSGSFLFPGTNAALIHQGRGMLGQAGNSIAP